MFSGDVVVCHPSGFISGDRLHDQNSLLQEVIGFETSSSRARRIPYIPDLFNHPCPDSLSLADQFRVVSALPSELSEAPIADQKRFFAMLKNQEVGSHA